VPSQQEVAEHLDMTRQSASDMLQKLGISLRSTSLTEIRVAYIRRLREQAAGRFSDGPLDLMNERARLAKEQADRLELQNALTRKEVAPVALIEQVLAKAGTRVAGILDAIPGMIKRRSPSLSSSDLDCVSSEIVKARNMAAAISLRDLDREALP